MCGKQTILAAMALLLCAQGCATPDSVPKPVKELFVSDGNMDTAGPSTERIWFVDEPVHITPEIVHGGIQ